MSAIAITEPELVCENEIEFVSKISLCILPTQLGKTFTTISRISDEIDQDNALGRSIHVVFAMNTLLNTAQFANRLETIEQMYGKGSVCVFSSTHSGHKYKHVKTLEELMGALILNCPRVIIMCSNSKRYDDGVEFLSVIDKHRGLNVARAFAYYDELHKYINDKRRTQIRQIHELEIVKGITALTATPDTLFQKSGFWSKIRLIYLNDLQDSNYAGCMDMIFNHGCSDVFDFRATRNPEDSCIDHIKCVLDNHPEILSDGSYVFIPAHNTRSSHNSVREMIVEINPMAVVVVINGKEKTIQYIDNGCTKTLLLTSKKDANAEEVCETIARLVIEHHLQNRPIVVTGYICVGMGQTLTHKSLGSFTSAIFGHVDLANDDIYQLFGRITGRMKEWGDKYRQTQVYCPTVIRDRCNTMEECARNMASEHNGEVITREDYREPMTGETGISAIENIREPNGPKSEDTDKDFKVFDSQEEAIIFAKKELGHRFKKRSSDKAQTELLQNGNNPTVEYLFSRMWGLKKGDKTVRMVPTDKGKWCVYWRPSSFVKPANVAQELGPDGDGEEQHADEINHA
jgi:hypothetical protein